MEEKELIDILDGLEKRVRLLETKLNELEDWTKSDNK